MSASDDFKKATGFTLPGDRVTIPAASFKERADKVTQLWKDAEDALREKACIMPAEVDLGDVSLQWAHHGTAGKLRIMIDELPALECSFEERLAHVGGIPLLLDAAALAMDQALRKKGF